MAFPFRIPPANNHRSHRRKGFRARQGTYTITGWISQSRRDYEIEIIVRGSASTPGFHSKASAERFRRLPGLFIADMGIAHGGADILVAEQFRDLPQILSNLIKEDRSRGVPQSVGGDLP